jgi:hypothetical protein
MAVRRPLSAYLPGMGRGKSPNADVGRERPASVQRRREWSSEQAIEAIRAHTDAQGRPPTSTEWRRPPAEAEERPGLGTVIRLFGSWSTALTAAGVPRSWTRERVIEAIRAHAAAHGQPPTPIQWRHSAGPPWKRGAHPKATTVSGLFGSFPDAVVAAGFEPRRKWRTWTREDVIAAIRAHMTRHEQPPLSQDWHHSSFELGAAHPTQETVRRLFGSFANAVVAAGFEPRSKWTRGQALHAIRDYVAEHGSVPSSEVWKDSSYEPGSRPSAATISRLFGSWKGAIIAAGLVPAPRRRPRHRNRNRKWTQETVAEAIRSWAAEHERPPRSTDWRHAADASAPGGAHPNYKAGRLLFGSWPAAVEAAGFEVTWPTRRPA